MYSHTYLLVSIPLLDSDGACDDIKLGPRPSYREALTELISLSELKSEKIILWFYVAIHAFKRNKRESDDITSDCSAPITWDSFAQLAQVVTPVLILSHHSRTQVMTTLPTTSRKLLFNQLQI